MLLLSGGWPSTRRVRHPRVRPHLPRAGSRARRPPLRAARRHRQPARLHDLRRRRPGHGQRVTGDVEIAAAPIAIRSANAFVRENNAPVLAPVRGAGDRAARRCSTPGASSRSQRAASRHPLLLLARLRARLAGRRQRARGRRRGPQARTEGAQPRGLPRLLAPARGLAWRSRACCCSAPVRTCSDLRLEVGSAEEGRPEHDAGAAPAGRPRRRSDPPAAGRKAGGRARAARGGDRRQGRPQRHSGAPDPPRRSTASRSRVSSPSTRPRSSCAGPGTGSWWRCTIRPRARSGRRPPKSGPDRSPCHRSREDRDPHELPPQFARLDAPPCSRRPRSSPRSRAPAADARSAVRPGPTEDDFFESIDVNVVNVDVYVTDKKGNRISGLTQRRLPALRGRQAGGDHQLLRRRRRRLRAEAAPDGRHRSACRSHRSGRRRRSRRPRTSGSTSCVYVDNFNIRPFNRNRVFTASATSCARSCAAATG